MPTASMAAGEPRSFVGPDGFPYASLRLPPVGEPFESYSLALVADWCTDNGCGAVLHGRDGEAAWVFTYGNLWSWRAAGTLDASPPGDDHLAVTLERAEEVLVGQPTEELLPPWARQVLRTHLASAGVAEPRVALVIRRDQVPARSLALDLPADPAAAHRLTWCLPPDMGLVDVAAVGGTHLEPL